MPGTNTLAYFVQISDEEKTFDEVDTRLVGAVVQVLL
jgi:hypothetical protein